MKTTLFAAIVLLISTAAFARDAFVGTWNVVITPGAEASGADAKEIKDTLSFKGSKFASTHFLKLGFPASNYEEDTRGGVMATFKAEVKSILNGTLDWSGTSTGTEMTGELKWTKKDGTEAHFTFKGTKKQ